MDKNEYVQKLINQIKPCLTNDLSEQDVLWIGSILELCYDKGFIDGIKYILNKNKELENVNTN